ncbi:MAG: Gfo/Idh/MocA family protein [Oscillospiraceae bacterium]
MRIALVGAGGMGTVHYSNYAHIPGCTVVALVGVSDNDKKKAKEWNLPLFASVPEMAQNVQADLLDVCTPTFLHKQHVLDGFANGLHVITEKPITLHKTDAEEVFAAADKAGKQLYVAQVLQFTREVEILHEVTESGRFGKPLDGYFERLSMCPAWSAGGWLFDKDKSGLLPFDLHIHDLDIIVSVFGRPQNFSYTSCGGVGKQYKEQYRFTYNYEGCNVGAEAAWFNASIPFTARWRVYFENAMLLNDGTSLTAYPAEGEPIVFDTEEKVKIPTGINVPPTGMFLAELTHFTDCAAKNIPSNKVPRSQVLNVVELLEEIVAGA